MAGSVVLHPCSENARGSSAGVALGTPPTQHLQCLTRSRYLINICQVFVGSGSDIKAAFGNQRQKRTFNPIYL